MYISLVGFDQETKTDDPFLVVRNNGDNVTIDSDGIYILSNSEIGYSYDIYVDLNESNVDPGFECTGLQTTETVALPFVSVAFVCAWTSNFLILW